MIRRALGSFIDRRDPMPSILTQLAEEQLGALRLAADSAANVKDPFASRKPLVASAMPSRHPRAPAPRLVRQSKSTDTPSEQAGISNVTSARAGDALPKDRKVPRIG